MTYDRDIYFANVRDELFSGALTQQQVDGQNVILAVWEHGAGGTPMTDERWLAYMLATVYHECATRMWPVTEYGSQDYLQSKEYFPYIGRGFVQLTWEANYRTASAALGLIDDRDLVEHPEMALDSLIAARCLFRGMAEGWYTGKQLGEYFNDERDDAKNARQIINGNDQDELIASYHDLFALALDAARVSEAVPPGYETVDLAIKTTPGVSISVTLNGEGIIVSAS